MREILFRGKDTAGNWHYGMPFVITESYAYMTAPLEYNKIVIPETIGQYTGVTDKKGRKIFEGDIVTHYINWLGKRVNGVVEYDAKLASWMCKFGDDERESAFLCDCVDNNGCEIIGNIHDNRLEDF